MDQCSAESGFIYRLSNTSDDPRLRETDRAPWNLTTDVRATRGFNILGMATGVFLEVNNLLDKKNILAFDNYNIPSAVIWEEDQNPTGDQNRAFSGSSNALYESPREIGLGLSFDF